MLHKRSNYFVNDRFIFKEMLAEGFFNGVHVTKLHENPPHMIGIADLNRLPAFIIPLYIKNKF